MALYNVVSKAYRADSKSIKELLFEICQNDKQRKFIMKSQVFHNFCREGLCNYSTRGCSDDGKTLISLKGPLISGFTIECVIHAHDNEYGVDAEIEEIYYQGNMLYQKPLEENAEALLLF